MARKDEIARVLVALRRKWEQYPEMRLGQLLVNAVGPSHPEDLFYTSNEDLVKALFDYEPPKAKPRTKK